MNLRRRVTRFAAAAATAAVLVTAGVLAAPAPASAAAHGHCNEVAGNGQILYPYLVPDLTWDCLLSVGDRYDAVVALQRSLRYCNNQNIAVDGIFGALTKRAVYNLQVRYNADDKDGVYGPETRRLMWHYGPSGGGICGRT